MTEFEKPNYIYQIKEITRVIDGDTIYCQIDLGMYTSVYKKIRFLNLDTDEMRGGTAETKKKARAAKAFLVELLATPDSKIYIKTKMDKTGKYGRLLGTIFVVKETGDIININETMVTNGYQKDKSLYM